MAPARLIILAAALGLLGAPAVQAAPATAAAAAPAPSLRILKPADIDPKTLLPPPPADGSDVQRAELADLHRVLATSSAARKAQAQWDNDHEDPSLFTAVLGVDPTTLPATKALLDMVINDQEIATNSAKAYFARKRPWAVDTSITACDYAAGKNPATSYPSGHAGIGYSAGLVLAYLLPDRAQAILARAADYAFSREVCGAHYHSDTEASHALANAVTSLMLRDPALQPKLGAARRELQAAVR